MACGGGLNRAVRGRHILADTVKTKRGAKSGQCPKTVEDDT